MKRYRFDTTTTMKEYNRKNWWIDRDIVPHVIVEAENEKDAIEQWREIVSENTGVNVSKNAIRNGQPMYRDKKDGTPVQVGYVITGKTDFRDEDRCRWVEQFVDLWTEINELVVPEFCMV